MQAVRLLRLSRRLSLSRGCLLVRRVELRLERGVGALQRPELLARRRLRYDWSREDTRQSRAHVIGGYLYHVSKQT